MSASDVSRSQRVLDKIGAKLGLTPQGKEWLIAAVDPYHDVPVNCVGYPDTNEAASVVQVVKFSQGFSVPNTVTAGENWDLHIHSFPWERPCGEFLGNYVTSNTSDQRGGNGAFLGGYSTTTPLGTVGGAAGYGGISVSSVPAGSPTFVILQTQQTPFFAELAPYMNGEYRIISKGFEVINTTNELTVQGLVTVYRQPCAPIDSAKSTAVVSATLLPGNYAFGYMDIVQTASPPINPTEALLLDGSKQWKAKEGCYVVPTLSSSELPCGLNQTTPNMSVSASDPAYLTPGVNGYGWRLMLAGGGSSVPNTFAYQGVNVGSTPALSTLTPLATGSAEFFNFNHAGAYFSGLSYSTTLQINAIYYIEKFPSHQDSALVVLARQSCRQDCVALDLYSEIIREMPVGVPQRLNGMGEWFADAVSSAVDFVSPVLSAIPHPYAQGAAMAAKTAKNVSQAIFNKKEASGQTYSAQGANVSAEKKKKKTIIEVVKKKKVPMKKK